MTAIDLKTGKEIILPHGITLSCAVGNFDGVHIGHAALLEKAAEKTGAEASAVWTFRVHPRICGGDTGAYILTSTEQKLGYFAGAGLDYALLEDFYDVRGLSPEEFVSGLLYKKYNIRTAVCGYNFRFGKDASGGADEFVKYFGSLGANAFVIPAVKSPSGEIVSSSLIRRKIENGEIESANALLGHPYQLRLPVSGGEKIGRSIGIPTINQLFPQNFVVPKYGVYVCRCKLSGEDYIGVANVGVRPTVREGDKVNCETHILGYSGWLYGKTVSVDFYSFLRPEKKFGSLDELSDAIRADICTASEYFK